MASYKVAGVIPSRYGSTRLPGKPLMRIGGKTLIQRVYERCAEAKTLDSLIVATDDDRIYKAVSSFGGQVVMTRPDHPSGTDRLAEVAQTLDADILVNIQGDQPFIAASLFDEAVQPLLDESEIKMSTLAYPLQDETALHNPAVVKVATNLAGYALYFSRSLIPFPRDGKPRHVYQHIGTYVYRKAFLLQLARLEPTPLERIESLEQLRWLENDFTIKIVETDIDTIGSDTPEDLAKT